MWREVAWGPTLERQLMSADSVPQVEMPIECDLVLQALASPRHGPVGRIPLARDDVEEEPAKLVAARRVPVLAAIARLLG